MLCLLPPECLPLGQMLSAAALIAAVSDGGVGEVRAGAALAELFSLGLADRAGDRYSPTSVGARALAMELLARSDRGDPIALDLPYRGSGVAEHRRYIGELLEAADELRSVERTTEGEQGA
ncbi:MAG: hypothetical protein M3P49_10200 [Actinomycetota bacterium]|nr:hypothetical protein [Actinomycetota bacterium]